jgi:hypothetical protein
MHMYTSYMYTYTYIHTGVFLTCSCKKVSIKALLTYIHTCIHIHTYIQVSDGTGLYHIRGSNEYDTRAVQVP